MGAILLLFIVFCRQYCLYPPQYRHTSAVTSVLPTDLAIPDIGAKLHKTRGNVKYIYLRISKKLQGPFGGNVSGNSDYLREINPLRWVMNQSWI